MTHLSLFPGCPRTVREKHWGGGVLRGVKMLAPLPIRQSSGFPSRTMRLWIVTIPCWTTVRSAYKLCSAANRAQNMNRLQLICTNYLDVWKPCLLDSLKNWGAESRLPIFVWRRWHKSQVSNVCRQSPLKISAEDWKELRRGGVAGFVDLFGWLFRLWFWLSWCMLA